jgi:hypothetical protein
MKEHLLTQLEKEKACENLQGLWGEQGKRGVLPLRKVFTLPVQTLPQPEVHFMEQE